MGKADRQKAQNELRIEIQNEVLRKARPKSMDEINLLMQKFYPMLCSDDEAERSGFRFKDSKNPLAIEKKLYLHYFHILEEFGDALISYRDGDVVFKYWKNDVNQDKKWRFIDFMDQYKGQDKVRFFHAISRFIPLDLIIMLHFIKMGCEILFNFMSSISMSIWRMQHWMTSCAGEWQRIIFMPQLHLISLSCGKP